MELLRDDLSAFEGKTVLTIGNFDGIHRGHQALIEHIMERAEALGVKSGVVTFDPHPATVLKPTGAPPLLTTLEEKIALLEGLGLDLLVLLTFNRELMQTRAATFLERLNEGLQPRELWVGQDFAMGYKREGDVAFIQRWAEPRAIDVHPISLIEVDGEVISSSRIRALLAEGDVEDAARLLGRPPSVTGIVRQGDRRGRAIGFPTANIIPPTNHALPANGVYATRTALPTGETIPSVTNVGTRPTFGGQQRQVESYLFDWSGDLYDQPITVHFLYHLREEKKFEGIEALLAQIRTDAAEARRLLAET
ncbi:MAG: bifunctional riboflavin kinase/FAD synthetase [Chloroflexota bacterium]|nr:bifunctional riboflavin kinase/FAD synthetase [Chloroflexota bacterium]